MNAAAAYQMTREEERAFVEQVRALHADASSDVVDRIDGGEHVLEGRIIPQKPRDPIAIFHPEADYRDVAFYRIAHKAVGVLLRREDRFIAYYNRVNPPESEETVDEKKPFSFAQNCAIYCTKPLFQKFMHQVHGLDHPHDQQRMRTKMHSMLAIKSRADLDTDETARGRWLSLRAEYKAWKDAKL